MKMLISGLWKNAEDHFEELNAMGYEPVLFRDVTVPMPCKPEEVEVMVCNYQIFREYDIEEFTNLKYVQLTSAGFDHVPVDYIMEHGIAFHNARGVYSVPMAEYAVGGVLYLYKKMETFLGRKKEHVWQREDVLLELDGKTVCIVGCGSVGSACAKRFQAFDMHVIGCDLYPAPNQFFEKIYPLDQLHSLIADSDIIVTTVPLSEDTYHMIGEKELAMMKPDAVLVNIARGPIVDTEALLPVLKDKKIFGAVLDVHEQEPLPETAEVWDLENVVVTPHNSFEGEKNQDRLWEVFKKNLSEWNG